MKFRFAALVLISALLIALCGCSDVVGEIAGNVADAARTELEKQIKTTFETYKVDIVEMKTAVGKLGGESDNIQFFCAVLVQSDSDAVPQSIADTLGKLFHDAGIQIQTAPVIQNDYLQNKTLSFKFDDFNNGEAYYTVWCYTDKLPGLDDLKELSSALTADSVG